MISPEVLPVAGGLVVGCVARYAYQRNRRWFYVAGVLLIALCATVASGEFRQSWGFLVDDLLLASLSACGAFLVAGLFIRRLPERR
jgi:hypothetical protein